MANKNPAADSIDPSRDREKIETETGAIADNQASREVLAPEGSPVEEQRDIGKGFQVDPDEEPDLAPRSNHRN
jgi:hypothetical protein